MGNYVTSVDPASGEEIDRYPLHDGAQVEAALARAQAAQRRWRTTSFVRRAEALEALADELLAVRDEAAALVTAEMGKTLREATAEVEKSAWVCRYYAQEGAGQLAPEAVATEAAETFVQFAPLGVVLAVMPWNYPIWQVLRAAAPALMAGNTIVLKHASNVTGSALLLADVFARVEASLLETVVVRGGAVAPIIADERVAAVTLTGSEQVGIQVATACAAALKPSVLELGGSDPFVVLEDADVEAAAAAAVSGRFLNAGQSCVAAKRFIVVEQVAEAFEAAFAERAAALAMGDPREEVDLGPMARADLRDELADQVVRGVAAGGRVLIGGEVPDRPGAWYPPTIVGGVAPDSPLAREETFGPAAAVLRVPDEAQALALANDSPYGLSSSVWTRDVERAKTLAPMIEAGAVFVNATTVSDPRMPFGGVKRSGWGRELGSFGIREFVNVQAVTVGHRRR